MTVGMLELIHILPCLVMPGDAWWSPAAVDAMTSKTDGR